MIIQVHTNKLGIKSTWMGDLDEATALLESIPKEKRGSYTFEAPLNTSPGIWRVDQKTDPK